MLTRYAKLPTPAAKLRTPDADLDGLSEGTETGFRMILKTGFTPPLPDLPPFSLFIFAQTARPVILDPRYWVKRCNYNNEYTC